MLITIPSQLTEYCVEAAVRLGYLRPELTFEAVGAGIQVSGPINNEAEVRQEVLYAVYRQKTFVASLPLRRSLMELLAGR